MARPRAALTAEPSPPRHLGDAQAQWFAAAPESEGLSYYLTLLRSKLWFIVVIIALCVVAAIISLAQAERVYQSTADLLITPVSSDNATLLGLGLPTASGDPSRDIQTTARLIRTQAVAGRVVRRLHLDLTPRQLLDNVDATPVATSDVVTIAARANDPNRAAAIANAFAAASVADRTQRMREQLDIVIPQLRQQLSRLQPSERDAREAISQRLRDLETLRAFNDPTIRLEVPAQASVSPISPRPVLTLAAAVLAGLAIGAAAVFGSQYLDPKLRREEQLRRYRIPILARVPSDTSASRREKKAPLLPGSLSVATRDSYALLAATLSGNQGRDGKTHSVLLTWSEFGRR